jgi:2'-5' RNA ligase superfamily
VFVGRRSSPPIAHGGQNGRPTVLLSARYTAGKVRLLQQLKQLLAFWLLPSADYEPEFARQIGELAQRYNTPVFTPHVTIYGETIDHEPNSSEIHALLEEAVREVSPIILQVTGVSASEKFTKTLFVEFADSPELSRLCSRFKQLSSNADYELRPHLSLLYAHLPPNEKQTLAHELQAPFEHVLFDRVCAITGNARTDSREDVESWRVIAESRLQ